MIDQIIARISELERRLANLCRLAKVTYVYRKTSDPDRIGSDPGDTYLGYVDVEFENAPLKRIPFLTMRHGEDKTFWLPSVGEIGLIFSPSGDLANAFFVPGAVYKDFPAHIPEGLSFYLSKRVFRDGQVEEINTEDDEDAHSYKYTTGNSERFVNRKKIEDKKGTSLNKIDDDETLLERTEGSIKIDGSEIEIARTAGKVEIKVGTTRLEISSTSIKGFIAGIGKLSVTATTVNVGGATFTAGATNMLNPAGPVTYPPVAIT